MFRLGRLLRRCNVPHDLVNWLDVYIPWFPSRIFDGWVHEELIINRDLYG